MIGKLLLMLCLAVLTRIQPSTCLSLRHHRTTCTDLRIQTREYKIRTHLYSKKKDDESNLNDKDGATPSLLMDPGLWISDFLSLILASQLIGLLNILNSPEFVANGGWLQPIPAVPSTLDDLVQRISVFGVVWAMASASVIFFSKTNSMEVSGSDTTKLLKKNVQTLAVFGILLLVGNGIVGDNEGQFPWLDTLRNCYYVGLSTSGLRFLYGRYFLLS